MQTYSLPDRPLGLILDMDGTLYENDAYVASQVDPQYDLAADVWGISVEDARERVMKWRRDYAERTGGKHQSLGNVFAELGIPIETSVRWRNEIIRPADFLARDEQLRDTLRRLGESLGIMVLTNNPVKVAQDTLDVLGIREFIRDIVGLDTTGCSKPMPEPFQEALRLLGCPPENTVSVGDRYDVDVAPALLVGMGGIVVRGVSEVYTLPDLLL